MRNLVLLTALLFSTFFAFTQEVEIEIEEDYLIDRITFSIEVDRNVFTDKTMNVYSTSDFMSTLLVTKQNVSYSSLKTEIEKEIESVDNLKVVERGEIKFEDVDLLYIKYETIHENITFMAVSYYKENDNTSVIGVIVKYPAEEKEVFEPIAKKAILSAKLN